MQRVIDADTHVVEASQVWEWLEKQMYHRRPVLLSGPSDTVNKRSVFWLIDGNLFPKAAGKGGFRLATPTDPQVFGSFADTPAREFRDIEGRLRAMDDMGVNTQVVYPTLFLNYITDDAELEIALYRAYNRFMADVWQKGAGRVRWVVLPPLRSIDATIEELNFAKDHGSAGVMFRGIERDRTLDDPYFFPVYKEAQRLDLPICIHTGGGSPPISSVFDLIRSDTFPHTRLLPLIAFRNLVANKIPELFPTLRFGCIETGASWVPYVLHSLRWAIGGGDDLGPRLFRDYRLYVTYEEREDLEYLMRYVGEDNLIVGSDWGHHGRREKGGDPSGQPAVFSNMKSQHEISANLVEKILVDNPRRFYGL